MVDNSKFEVLRSDGVKYLDFRKTLKPIYNIVWRDITLGYLALVFFMILSLFFEDFFSANSWMLIPVFSFIIGYIIAFLQLFCHEAIHFNIHSNKKKNDVLANMFLFSIVGKDIESCRQKHWQHHNYFGTTKDPENAYFNPISNKLYFRFLTGIYFFQNILIPRIAQILQLKLNKRDGFKLFMFLTGVAINASIILICFKSSHWQTGLIWILALTVFFPLFSTVRMILEHRNKLANTNTDYSTIDHGKVSRIFEKDFFSRTFGGAGFNRQLLHQWDPEISYTRFDDMEDFLLDCPKCWINIYRSKTSYFDTYLWLVR